ncbi:MAG: class I SAM-dependent methyltransferase [Myxococcota bacterium]
MGFFDTMAGVRQYEKLAEGYDGRALVDRLMALLPQGKRVLELGMGPGKDLDMLLETYEALGSDASQVFVDRYRARGGRGEVMVLDAVALDVDRKFDAIYSNKVLHHLTRETLEASLERQCVLLEPGGIAFHALWYGDKEETHEGLRFVHYTEQSLTPRVPEGFSIEEQVRYGEMADGDSFYVVLRKR